MRPEFEGLCKKKTTPADHRNQCLKVRTSQISVLGPHSQGPPKRPAPAQRPTPPPIPSPAPGTVADAIDHRRRRPTLASGLPVYTTENRKLKSSGVSGAPPLCAISVVGTASAPPPHGSSGRLTSAPQPRGSSGRLPVYTTLDQ
jgi:hypothetical protein